jgi:hypothetical protein
MLTAAIRMVANLSGALAWADKQEEKREQQAEQKAAQELKQAQDKLEASKKSLANAVQAAKQAESSRDNAAKKLKTLHDRVADKYLDKSGLADARKQQAAARQALDQALATFRATPAYKAAADAAAAARRDYGKGDTSKANLDRLKGLIQRPAELEQAAIAADPQLLALQSKLTKADQDVAAGQKKLDDMIAKDWELANAEKDFKKDQDHLESAKKHVADAQRDMASHHQKVSQEAAQLAKVKAANRADDLKDKQQQNKNNNNKNNKNNKKK